MEGPIENLTVNTPDPQLSSKDWRDGQVRQGEVQLPLRTVRMRLGELQLYFLGQSQDETLTLMNEQTGWCEEDVFHTSHSRDWQKSRDTLSPQNSYSHSSNIQSNVTLTK